jgi:hypothetical protein
MRRYLAPSMRPLALLPVVLIACAHQRAAEESSRTAKTAAAEANGVRVTTSADAWKDSRSRSAQSFTPIKVSVENHSGRTLSLAYHDFSLADRSGAQYLPLLMRNKSREAPHGSVMASAAYQHVEVYAPTSESCGGQDRLVDAPYPAFSYTGPLPAGTVALSYTGPQPASNVFPYAAGGDSWCPEQLPTQQMVAEALPEKPLPSEARVEGFVYFQAQGDRGSPARLTMNLVDAATGQPFGRVELNFAASD